MLTALPTEIRSTKYETRNNLGKRKRGNLKTANAQFGRAGLFRHFFFGSFEFISDFVLRNSCLPQAGSRFSTQWAAMANPRRPCRPPRLEFTHHAHAVDRDR